MKTIKIASLFALLLAFGCNCNNTNSKEAGGVAGEKPQTVDQLINYRTTQYFTKDKVAISDMKTILEAGRNASSGLNKQLWFFSAIVNQDIIASIASELPERKPRPSANKPNESGAKPVHKKTRFADAPAIIVISCEESQRFAAGLATEAMLVTAKSLGYGTKVMAGATRHLNTSEIIEKLQIPDNTKAVALLVVGHVDTDVDIAADGVTGASTRKPSEDIYTGISLLKNCGFTNKISIFKELTK